MRTANSRPPAALLTLLAVCATALPVSAMAQVIPCREGPCLRPHRGGTHFIAEVAGGSVTYGKGGLALEALLGVGGKLRGFPARFYLIGEVAYSASAASGAAPSEGVHFRDERSYRDLSGGLRVYLPIYGPIRIFGDALLGGSHVLASIDDGLGYQRDAEAWRGLMTVGGGLQVRIFHQLSVGARLKVAITDDDVGLRRLIGAEAPTRASATVGLTWHF